MNRERQIGRINVGSEVFLSFGDGETQWIEIVPRDRKNEYNNDVYDDKKNEKKIFISEDENLSRLLKGKRRNQVVEYMVGGNKNRVKILEIK